MTLYLNDSEVLTVFKITELSRSYSKRIKIHFSYVNKATDGKFLDLCLKSIPFWPLLCGLQMAIFFVIWRYKDQPYMFVYDSFTMDI